MLSSRFALLVRRVIFILLTAILWIPALVGMTRIVFAEEEFATSYDVVYDVASDGITTVTEKVTLENLTSQYYATEFKLTIGATQISNIKASDPAGPMGVSAEQKDTATIITVKFNQQIAGIGKTLPWTLQFKSNDFAQRQGKIWEVSVPKVNITTNLESYKLTLSVPASFGQTSLISPTPKSQTSNFNKIFLTFDKDQLTSTGVSATFGTFQLYNFDLAYNLENSNLVPILTNIALPPDTAYQDVIYNRIEPKPINVTVDQDGNYLAWYRLERSKRVKISVIGSAKLYSSSKVKDPTLSEDLKNKYTQTSKYWEKDHPVIKTKIDEILKDSKTTTNQEKARLIYLFLVGFLKYDGDRLNGNNIERLGAVTALNNPSSAVCMEFTDLFIALARASGIPARELDGFAYTANSTLRPLSLNRDILHAWPEYWDDSKGWVMIDPTWGNTTGGVDYFNKFDLNHFVFAIKGHSSEQPVPAGSYKYQEEDSRDVKVNLSENDFLGKSQLDVTIDAPEPIIAGFPSKISVKVANNGNALQQSIPFAISSAGLNFLKANYPDLGSIPAFGNASFEFDTRTKSFLDSYDDTILVNLGKDSFTKQVKIRPFVIFNLFPIVLLLMIFSIVGIYFLVLGGFIYRRRFLRKSSVISPQSSDEQSSPTDKKGDLKADS